MSANSETVTYARIYSETIAQIDKHLKRVKEGKGVDAACEFGRYVFWSDLPDLLKAHSSPAPFKCDGAFLEWRLKELQEACNAFYRSNGKPDNYQSIENLAISEKVEKLQSNFDLVAGQLAKLTSAISDMSRPVPQFTIVDNGGTGEGARSALSPAPVSLIEGETSHL